MYRGHNLNFCNIILQVIIGAVIFSTIHNMISAP